MKRNKSLLGVQILFEIPGIRKQRMGNKTNSAVLLLVYSAQVFSLAASCQASACSQFVWIKDEARVLFSEARVQNLYRTAQV